jgi:peptidoglycan-associated lipoprotein
MIAVRQSLRRFDMRGLVRTVGLIGVLAAALAVSACANKPGDQTANAGAAAPGSQQDFVVNV